MKSDIEGVSAHGAAEIGLDVLADLPDFSDNMLEHMDSNKSDEGGFQTEIPPPQQPGLGFNSASSPNEDCNGSMRSERNDSSGAQIMDQRQFGAVGGSGGGGVSLYGGGSGGGGGPPTGASSMKYPHGPPHGLADINEEAHHVHQLPHQPQPQPHSHWTPYGIPRATPHDGGGFHPQNPPQGGGHPHPGPPDPYHGRHHALPIHDGGSEPGYGGYHSMAPDRSGGVGYTRGPPMHPAPMPHHGGGIDLGYYPPTSVRHAPPHATGPGGAGNPPPVPVQMSNGPVVSGNGAAEQQQQQPPRGLLEQRGQTPPPPRSMMQGMPQVAPIQQWTPTPHFWGGHMGAVTGRPMDMSREEAARKVGYSEDTAPEGYLGMGWQPGQGSTGHFGSMKEHTDKRRQDRNNREQKRSKRISDQIKELKALLEESGVSTSKGNKSSVLTCAADFIADLQRQNAALSRENTHAQRGAEQHPPHVVGCGGGNSPPQEGERGGGGGGDGDRCGSPSSGGSDDGVVGGGPPGADGRGEPSSGRGPGRPGHVENDEDERSGQQQQAHSQRQQQQQQQARGVAGLRSRIDYQRVFRDQGVAMAITSVDGRFLDCNWRFERESGYSKDDLLHMTFFTLARSDGDANIFHLVAEMLKVSREDGHKECIVRAVLKNDDQQMDQQQPRFLKLSTVHEHDGPMSDVKFFSCALLHTNLNV